MTQPSDPAEPMPAPPLDTFVGREIERREFRNSVRYALQKDSSPYNNKFYPHIFLLYGEGGMGKSALLYQFVQIARQEGLSESGMANPVHFYDLNNLTLQDDEVREYLRRRLEASVADTQAEKIARSSRGIPLAVEALVNQLGRSRHAKQPR